MNNKHLDTSLNITRIHPMFATKRESNDIILQALFEAKLSLKENEMTETKLNLKKTKEICKCGKCYNDFRGAGVIPVDYKNGELILVKDWREGFGDAGGKYESHHRDLTDTAAHECHEEFRTLIDIRNKRELLNKCRYVNIMKHHKYRTYFLPIKGSQLEILCERFNAPETIEKIKYMGSDYNETTDIAKFSITKIKQAWLANNKRIPQYLEDVTGKTHKVYNRFQRSISVAFYRGIF